MPRPRSRRRPPSTPPLRRTPSPPPRTTSTSCAFSRKGLIEQLSSEYGYGFSKADAIFAVNHIDVNWNKQAAKAAKDYLDFSAFSRNGLIEQL